MGSRFISAVALYGSTAGPVRDFLADCPPLTYAIDPTFPACRSILLTG